MSSEAIGAIAERYSAALFDLAEQSSVLDTVAADLKTLRAMIAGSGDLRCLLGSPVLSRHDQQKALLSVAERCRFDTLTRNFLGLLAKNRRLFAIGAIVETYLNRLAAKRGDSVAHVASAIPLNKTQLTAIGDTLKRIVGNHVTLDAIVDPTLLGGLVVKIGSRMVDGSLKTKLQHLQLAMKGVG